MKAKLLYIIFGLFVMIYGCASQDSVSINSGSDNTNSSTESGNAGTEEAPVMYTVTFHSNGADKYYSEMKPFINCSSKGVELPENRFLKTGYKFIGWSLNLNDMIMYENMQVIKCDQDMDLYAVWEEKSDDNTGDVLKHRVFFNGNGADGTMGSMEVIDNTKVTLKQNIFKRNGYNFLGWSKVSDGDVEFYDEGVLEPNESVTLYAVWQKRTSPGSNTVKVTLYPLDSDEGKDEIYVEKGQEFYLPYNKKENAGKVFAGWSTSPNAAKADYQEGEYGFFNSDTIIYGVWLNEADTYKVTLDCNGGVAINMPSALYIPKGEKLFLPRISCDLYNRKVTNKYAVNPEDPINNVYISGSEIEVSDTTTLYVLWSIDDQILENTVGGSCIECANKTFFAKDVQAPKEEDWVLDFNQYTPSVEWKDGLNWFHVYQSMLNLCWAATSSNAFHWWTTVNEKYINAYYDYKAQHNEPIAKPDLEYHPEGKPNYKQSGVFWEFSNGGIWANAGNNPALGFVWLVYGQQDRKGGAYFKEIFETSNNQVAESFLNMRKRNFNEIVKATLVDQTGVMGIGTVTTGSHAITLWGVTYDKDGYVNGVYTTDSAYDGRLMKGGWGGLNYDKVIYSSSGMPYMQNKAGYTFPIESVYSYYQNEADWIKFLKSKGVEIPK